METTTFPLGKEAVPDLTRADRCDRCGSQAYVRATMTTHAELLVCGHHANEHRPALLVAGATFHDETNKLTIRSESSLAV